MRLAALCRCGRCGGPRRWSFSAGARAGPPVARSARHASMLLGPVIGAVGNFSYLFGEQLKLVI